MFFLIVYTENDEKMVIFYDCDVPPTPNIETKNYLFFSCINQEGPD